MKEEITNFIQTNSPDGGFLQSEEWRKFQEEVGRKTFAISEDNLHANIIEHKLPIVGKYFYIPRGPVIEAASSKQQVGSDIKKAIDLAKTENAGWIRFDANNSQILDIIRLNSRVFKAPHDMQPREIFVVDISKSEEDLLAEMKSKTRYNIRLALKHKVLVRAISNDKFLISNQNPKPKTQNLNFYFDEFLRLVKITAKRDGITPHPDVYYRKMFETIPAENIKLYVAEYENKIIAANIIVFYGKVATYLHGASDHNYRNVMAPYLLQWQAMLDAKAVGCANYDFGGVKSHNENRIMHNEKDDMRYEIRDTSSWSGITKFKTGFSTTTKPLEFLGSYDIVINPFRYNLYKTLQRIKNLF